MERQLQKLGWIGADSSRLGHQLSKTTRLECITTTISSWKIKMNNRTFCSYWPDQRSMRPRPRWFSLNKKFTNLFSFLPPRWYMLVSTSEGVSTRSSWLPLIHFYPVSSYKSISCKSGGPSSQTSWRWSTPHWRRWTCWRPATTPVSTLRPSGALSTMLAKILCF